VIVSGYVTLYQVDEFFV